MNSKFKIINNEIFRYCNTCKQWLQQSNFNIDRSSLHNNRGGYCTQCKECQHNHYIFNRQKLLQDKEFALHYKLCQALKGAKRRSKIKNNYLDIDLSYLYYLWDVQSGKCAITNIPMTFEYYKGRVNTNLSIDRIDSSKGYIKGNIWLVCMCVNQMKNDLSLSHLDYLCDCVLKNAMQREQLKAKTALKNPVVGQKSIPKSK